MVGLQSRSAADAPAFVGDTAMPVSAVRDAPDTVLRAEALAPVAGAPPPGLLPGPIPKQSATARPIAPETACRAVSIAPPAVFTRGASTPTPVVGLADGLGGGAGRPTRLPELLPPIGQEPAYSVTLLTNDEGWRASLIEVSAAVEPHRPTVAPLQGVSPAPAQEPPVRPPACPAAPASVTSGSSGMGGGHDGSILAPFLAGADSLTLARGAALGLARLAARQRAERIVVPPD